MEKNILHQSVKIFFLSLLILLAHSISAQVTGRWKTIDDADGKQKSVVEIYEQQGKLYGRVIELAPEVKSHVCDKCSGDLKNKPIVGMVIMKDVKKTEVGGVDGKVMDPGNGKTYSCNLELVSPNKLKLRGYIGVAAIGRTQYWERLH